MGTRISYKDRIENGVVEGLDSEDDVDDM